VIIATHNYVTLCPSIDHCHHHYRNWNDSQWCITTRSRSARCTLHHCSHIATIACVAHNGIVRSYGTKRDMPVSHTHHCGRCTTAITYRIKQPRCHGDSSCAFSLVIRITHLSSPPPPNYRSPMVPLGFLRGLWSKPVHVEVSICLRLLAFSNRL
jgi:hypothetical protein